MTCVIIIENQPTVMYTVKIKASSFVFFSSFDISY